MHFTKMEGCGNDFIVVFNPSAGAANALIRKAPSLCDRRTGIGADGLVFVGYSSMCDFSMRIINADGSEAEMCGNGLRCLGRYIRQNKLIDQDLIAVATKAAPVGVEMANEYIRVNMNAPRLSGSEIPVEKDADPIINEPVTIDDREFLVTAVSMGNPHAVIFAHELTDDLVLNWGRRLESHPFFPRRTNVEFVKVHSPHEISMRVFERGVGETMACGTGACASVVAAVLNEKVHDFATVHLRGGDVTVNWDGDREQPVFLAGPARQVFTGTVRI
ncbi:MAG: diaminopimelate epimerase [Chitinivibrionales bacterium]|nr:diaminopimelate epimerase [Chitinivibrionales bacterium]